LRHDVEKLTRVARRRASGAVETIHRRPWSTVLRVPTPDGDLYLKQEQPLQA
jgi:hypothetical protein